MQVVHLLAEEEPVPRKILHLDLDAFFCAVEELDDPTLRGKPFAVGGRPDSRGVVASCSYAARRYGVRSAQPMAHAVRLCPELIVQSSRYSAYREASGNVMERLRALTPLVEQISIDEAFLDVTDRPEVAEDLARRLQRDIGEGLGLPCSLGVATNKLVAKIATNIGKATSSGVGPPRAILVVSPGREAEFLAPFPTEALWGVGPKLAERLAELGMVTIGGIASKSDLYLSRRFGKTGLSLARRARGIDDSPVVTHHEAKSISRETTFARDVSDGEVLRRTLRELAHSVSRRLRRARLRGTTVKLKLRWEDFTTLTRQETLAEPTDEEATIGASALGLLEKTWIPGQLVRLIGVGISGLGAPLYQLGLWDRDWQKEAKLLRTLDDLCQRFGPDVVRRGWPDERGGQ